MVRYPAPQVERMGYLVEGLTAQWRYATSQTNGFVSTYVLLRWMLYPRSRAGRGPLTHALVVAALVAGAALPATASDWSATLVKGTVLILDGESWQEVERGSLLPESYAAIRTLQSGRLEMQIGASKLIIGRNTTLELVHGSGGKSLLLRQHSGEIVLQIESSVSQPVTVEALNLIVVAQAGEVSVAIAGEKAEMAVEAGGRATVVDPVSGDRVTLVNGQSASREGKGGVVIASTHEGAAPAAAEAALAAESASGREPRAESSDGSSGVGRGEAASTGNDANGKGANGNGASGNGESASGASGAGTGVKGSSGDENASNGASGSAKANENANGNAGSENSNAGGNSGASGADHKGGKDG